MGENGKSSLFFILIDVQNEVSRIFCKRTLVLNQAQDLLSLHLNFKMATTNETINLKLDISSSTLTPGKDCKKMKETYKELEKHQKCLPIGKINITCAINKDIKHQICWILKVI